jgi:hypothetical protein
MPAHETAEDFLAARLRLRRDSFGTGYMFRTADYIRVGGIPMYRKLMFADDALWLALMRETYKATLPRELFSYRLHSGATSHSPDWRSTFDALGRYLEFLDGYGQSNEGAHGALQHGLADYMTFWFRCMYFSGGGKNSNRSEILSGIESLSAKAAEINDSLRSEIFKREVSHALHARLPRWRWYFWQIDRYLRLRLQSNLTHMQQQ